MEETTTKFELGPIQKEWLKSLKENPHRQMRGQLGKKWTNSDIYHVCCLGEAGLIAGVCEWKDIGGGESILMVKDSTHSSFLYCQSFKALGLYGPSGPRKDQENVESITLGNYNDNGMAWPEIAAMIEANPTDWFKESK